jgi:hypothetical protein
MTGCSGELGFLPYFELKEKYIDAGNYDSLLFNEETGSMEMVVTVVGGGGRLFGLVWMWSRVGRWRGSLLRRSEFCF